MRFLQHALHELDKDGTVVLLLGLADFLPVSFPVFGPDLLERILRYLAKGFLGKGSWVGNVVSRFAGCFPHRMTSNCALGRLALKGWFLSLLFWAWGGRGWRLWVAPAQ
jgi:hypothetical protein